MATFNKEQIEKVPQSLGLNYRWEQRNNVSWIIVEETIEYNAVSFWVIHLQKEEKCHSKTFEKFQEWCNELKNIK